MQQGRLEIYILFKAEAGVDMTYLITKVIMMSCATVVFFTLVAIASVDSTSNQVTKADIMHKMDSKTILEMLVKAMEREYADKDDAADKDDVANANQVIYCLKPKIPRQDLAGPYGTMNLELLQDLLQSSVSGSPEAFVITYHNMTKEGYIFHHTLQNEHLIYDVIKHGYGKSSIETPTDIWFNKVPCLSCITRVMEIFGSRGVKPTLHIETLDFTENDIENLMQSIGCLALLQSQGFEIIAWNWNVFEAYLTETVHCKNTIDDTTKSMPYIMKKSHFTTFMEIFKAMCESEIVGNWCK